jgi:hypothetical protein
MTKISDLHKKWMKDPEYRKEYAALEEEFAELAAQAKARMRKGLHLPHPEEAAKRPSRRMRRPMVRDTSLKRRSSP